MTELSPDALLDLARAAALAGGEVLDAHFGKMRDDAVRQKALGDYASQADLAAEEAIAAVLATAGDAYGFLGEETGTRQAEAERRWVVDPLDGTSNFIWGIPYFAVSIALCDGDGEILGVVYDPLRQEMFTAIRGAGARLNGVPLPRLREKKPQDAILSLSLPVRGQLKAIGREAFFKGLDRVADMTAGVRRLGSAALDLAYIGAGRLDGYFEDGLSYYDYAAGKLVAEEAGAHVTDLFGKRPGEGSIVAGPAGIHRWLREEMFVPAAT
ncbi:inositol monophosphatase [Rhizobium sp. Leaf384]|uniref:inositol monophosphatase family protein n=1 Tax=unclassified Rhizobium TaxID=2613769 RepID=UPI00071252AA|nr:MULTISPECIES: inositol monophosphatase family protein [unclassified Rhizobium]KQS78870.1 inositol monophosphatase [Rhizobium sp. Leaf384]KQS85495.1 inositol monophosphatase [Rhizobium sp. Leaf383]